MRLKLISVSLATVLSAHAGAALAAEGMWVPQQLAEISGPLKKAGLKLSPRQLASLTGDPMGAVVALGGCTASFVSPGGLVVTNHHCAYGAIQLNSTASNNLIRQGFNPATPADELSAGPNARIYVLDSIKDVTAQAKEAIASAAMTAGSHAGAGGVRQEDGCRVEPSRLPLPPLQLSGGNAYRLFRNWKSGTCAWPTRRPVEWASTAATSTTGCGRATPATSRSIPRVRGKDGKPAAFSADNGRIVRSSG